MTTVLSTVPPANLLQATAADAEAQANILIAQYSGWATAIMRVVEEKELFKVINQKKYLLFEAWQIIGAFDRAHANTDNVTKVEENGEIVGYVCHAQIIKDGIRIGGAMQMCGLDAFPCRGKEGTAKHNAAISACQTWAGSKAFKMLYSSVAVLGGYGAATAEEMERAEQEADKTQHWCVAHETNWFKRGKMNHYAHPIGETGQWCNEPGRQAPADKAISPAPSGSQPASPEPAITYTQLRAEVEDSGMTWAQFEIEVLGKTWDTFSKVRGANASVAHKMWETWKAKNEPEEEA